MYHVCIICVEYVSIVACCGYICVVIYDDRVDDVGVSVVVGCGDVDVVIVGDVVIHGVTAAVCRFVCVVVSYTGIYIYVRVVVGSVAVGIGICGGCIVVIVSRGVAVSDVHC